eukprot:CAMPEP_0180443468 /NCGR_PEP_ID=MMETSP1036_2-20121128/14690_1 /TAXON_ID=632150 /ORGANISM="Azadinium spinosum, Strain 3D9" /LENGTH=89 /DNA_ID=CAMNT_0022449781 /DNA_START=292 /DNA_END=557 /DNA_ORIENTATION=-
MSARVSPAADADSFMAAKAREFRGRPSLASSATTSSGRKRMSSYRITTTRPKAPAPKRTSSHQTGVETNSCRPASPPRRASNTCHPVCA